jgi:hypothetical protein
MTVSIRNFPSAEEQRATATVEIVPSVILAEGATKVAAYKLEAAAPDVKPDAASNLLQAAPRAKVHFSPPVVDSPALFQRFIRDSYGRYLHPHRRTFSAHA